VATGRCAVGCGLVARRPGPVSGAYKSPRGPGSACPGTPSCVAAFRLTWLGRAPAGLNASRSRSNATSQVGVLTGPPRVFGRARALARRALSGAAGGETGPMRGGAAV